MAIRKKKEEEEKGKLQRQFEEGDNGWQTVGKSNKAIKDINGSLFFKPPHLNRKNNYQRNLQGGMSFQKQGMQGNNVNTNIRPINRFNSGNASGNVKF